MKRLRLYLKLTAKHLLRSGGLIEPYINQVESCFSMSEEELNKYKEKKFIEIFRRAYDKSPFYHKLYSETGIRKEDIKGLDDLQKLPIITKEMVRQHAEEILTVPKWRVLETHTSGTTGTPLHLYEDWPSLWREQAYHICARRRAGFVSGDSFVSLRGHLDKNITHLFVASQNTLFLSSYNINSTHVDQYYRLIREHRPKAIEGYPSSLYTLALLLSDRNLSLNIPVAFTSSETLFPYQRELIERVLNTEIFDLYGMTERTICLMEANNHKEYYEMPGYSINEYFEDGEICTSLINSSFPLIRYRSNDVIKTEITNTDIWRTKAIQGKIGDHVKSNDDSVIVRLDHVLDGVDNVKRARLMIEKDDSLSINVVPEEAFSETDVDKIEENFRKSIGSGIPKCHINIIDSSQLTNSPKRNIKYFVDLEKTIASKRGRIRINSIQGRMDDYVICKDGSKVTRLGFVVKDIPNIRYTQLFQEEIGKLEVRIVVNKEFDSKYESVLISNIYKRLGKSGIDVTIRRIEEKDLIYSSRGKLKYIISNCKIQ